MNNKYFRWLIMLWACMYGICVYAQKFESSYGNCKCRYEITPEGQLIVRAVYNYHQDHNITIFIDGEDIASSFGPIASNGGSLPINKQCENYVKMAEVGQEGMTIVLDAKTIIEKWKKEHETKNAELSQEQTSSVPQTPQVPQNTQNPKDNKDTEQRTKTQTYNGSSKVLYAVDVIEAFRAYVDTDSYYSSDYMQEMHNEIDAYVKALKYMEKESRETYIKEEHLNGYVTDAADQLQRHKETTETYVNEYLENYYKDAAINDKQTCLDEMHKLLQNRLNERDEAIASLEEALKPQSATAFIDELLNDKSKLANLSVVALLTVTLLITIVVISKRSSRRKQTYKGNTQPEVQADIIVRRKTTSILKKQSLEDVHNNPAYMKIDCADFCDDSAVRRIYLKNTCIKDIYNMYAEDLRNAENPNEDGCMVLGRWVHDNENDEYYVSLEEIVKPGDDAVFKEYELNFGGKIKLKVNEKLRKLRRETNLQYDMTCWVHSHPGLGVFFSNADSAVQMQMKHPTHPKFLTAMVIDILTPDQELGIFTFKRDMTILSKADLKKMYSLEDMYKWAVVSERESFKADDYYNIMKSAQKRIPQCDGIELSNGAIIDICQIEIEQRTGMVGWVYGFTCEKGDRKKFVVKSVPQNEFVSDDEVLGAFVIGTHRSIPTIRKAITNIMGRISFVIFYSTTDGTVTSIPMIDGNLSAEEDYYGEETLEELKIWTRRKR